MKKIIRTLAALTLALVLAASLSAAAWADGETGNTETTKELTATVTVEGLVDGEIVNAYRLIEYGTNYNTMTIIDSYKAYVKDKLNITSDITSDETEDILRALSFKPAAGMLEGYLATTKPSLPAVATVNASNNQATFTFTPGYYLLTVATNTNADRLYRPMGVFVQPYGDKLHIYAGDVADPTIGNSAKLIAKSVAGTVIDKKVKDGDEWKTTATAGVGDTAKFYIEIIIPYYGSGSSITMTLTDTLEHMSYVNDSAALYSTLNADGTFSDAVTTAGTFEVNTTNGLKFTLDYDKLMTDAAADKAVYLYYEATVDQSAANGGVAKNEARLTYANAADPTNAKTTDSQIVKVYNYEFNLEKKNETGYTSLSGAEFTIYSDVKCTQAISFVKDNESGNYVRSTADGAVTAIPADFTVSGLAPGVYYVKETTTPRGYFAPAGIFKLTLTAAKDAGSTEYSGALDADGSTFTANDNDEGLVVKQGVVTNNANRYSVSLKNALTPVLPSTGGAGTVMFTVGGVAVMVLAAVLFLRRKREE